MQRKFLNAIALPVEPCKWRPHPKGREKKPKYLKAPSDDSQEIKRSMWFALLCDGSHNGLGEC